MLHLLQIRSLIWYRFRAPNDGPRSAINLTCPQSSIPRPRIVISWTNFDRNSRRHHAFQTLPSHSQRMKLRENTHAHAHRKLHLRSKSKSNNPQSEECKKFSTAFSTHLSSPPPPRFSHNYKKTCHKQSRAKFRIWNIPCHYSNCRFMDLSY